MQTLRRLALKLIIVCVLSVSWCSMASAEKTKLSSTTDVWLRLAEIEEEKTALFDKYQEQKSDLDARYQYDFNHSKTLEDGAKFRKKLNRVYKQQKEKLLQTYRSKQRKLEKEERRLKGRPAKIDIRSNAQYRLKKDDTYSTRVQRSPSKRGGKSYIKKSGYTPKKLRPARIPSSPRNYKGSHSN